MHDDLDVRLQSLRPARCYGRENRGDRVGADAIELILELRIPLDRQHIRPYTQFRVPNEFGLRRYLDIVDSLDHALGVLREKLCLEEFSQLCRYLAEKRNVAVVFGELHGYRQA